MPRWHREIFQSPDADVRRAAGQAILASRRPSSGLSEVGCVVEFTRGRHLCCGVIWPHPSRRRNLLVVDVQGAEVFLRRDKVLHQSTQQIPTGRRPETLRALRHIDGRREDLKHTIDMATLWEIAVENTQGEADASWSLDRLADLYFGSDETEDGRASLLRALHTGDWFARARSGWVALSRQVMAGRDRDRLLRQRDERELEAAAVWLRAVADGESMAPPPDGAAEAVRLLEQVSLSTATGTEAGRAAQLMERAHLHGPMAALRVLVNLGHWREDENLDLHRWGVPVAFSDEAELAASRWAESKKGWLPLAARCRRVWRWRRRSGAVGFGDPDGADTCDRAFSVTRSRGGFRVRVYFAAPALALEEGGVLDREAASRGLSLRLPDQDIPLLPRAFRQSAQLSGAEVRPAVVVEIRLDADLRVRQRELGLRRVRPAVVLATEVPAPAAVEGRLGLMADLASHLRRQRVSAGAVILPAEVGLSVRAGQARIEPAQTGVAELIAVELNLLAAAAVGAICSSEEVPAIYQVQDSPLRPSSHGVADLSGGEGMVAESAVAAHPLQRDLRWPRLQVAPAANELLGLDLCVAASDPLDSHADLVMQRQLVHVAIHRRPAYTEADLERELLNTATARDAARRATVSGRRYWMVKHLEAKVGDEVEAVVLERAGFGYVVLVDECFLKAYVPADRELWATAGDRVRLRVEQVSARRDAIRLAAPRPRD